MDFDTSPLASITLEHALLGLAAVYFVYNQFLIPWRRTGIKEEQRLDHIENRVAHLEQHTLNKAEFMAAQAAREVTLQSIESRLKRIEEQLDDIRDTTGLTNQQFEGRISALETCPSVKKRGE